MKKVHFNSSSSEAFALEETESTTYRQLVDIMFKNGKKLNDDYCNAFIWLGFYIDSPMLFDKIEPILTYQQYFSQYSEAPTYILEKSNPFSVTRINELVMQFKVTFLVSRKNVIGAQLCFF
jgi:hypothetical protein